MLRVSEISRIAGASTMDRQSHLCNIISIPDLDPKSSSWFGDVWGCDFPSPDAKNDLGKTSCSFACISVICSAFFPCTSCCQNTFWDVLANDNFHHPPPPILVELLPATSFGILVKEAPPGLETLYTPPVAVSPACPFRKM